MKDKKRHTATPFFTALHSYANSAVVPLDVPGHKMGNMPNALQDAIGEMAFRFDVNAPKGLDNLSRPRGVILEAEALMADAFDATHAKFLVNGTTVGILAMIMATCRAREKIIMPRNVHKSAINALILSGAVPIFVKPDLDSHLGIANGMHFNEVKKAIEEHPDAKAVFVINPTYFGVVSDLKAICDLAHEHNMIVLVDEAHGSQFAFSSALPAHGIKVGADIVATSIHKTVGSLTQSSVLLMQGERYDQTRLYSTLNMLQTTSPNNLLLASMDVARSNMVLQGEAGIAKTIILAESIRKRINAIPGLSCLGSNYFQKRGFLFDHTKLIIRVSDLGISGFEAYHYLRDTFDIQFELAETHVLLAVLSMGTTATHMDRLIEGLKELSNQFMEGDSTRRRVKFEYAFPESYARPRSAYHAPKKYVLLDDALDEISAESIMIYPPGIPIVIPGEIISQDVIDDIHYYRESGSVILSDEEDGYVKVVDKENWIKWSEDDDTF